MMNRLITITEERLNKAKTPKGSYNAKQLRVLGINYPPKKGWKKKLIGEKVTLLRFIEFVKASRNKVYLQEIELLLPTLTPPVKIPEGYLENKEYQHHKSKKEKVNNRKLAKKERRKLEIARKVNKITRSELLNIVKNSIKNPHIKLQSALNRVERLESNLIDYDDAAIIYGSLKRSGVILTWTNSGEIVTQKFTPTKKLQSKQFVYIIRAIDADRVKIGISQDPKKRLGALRTSSPHKLKISLVFRPNIVAIKLEQSLHKMFSTFRCNGEWFSSITDQEIIKAIGNRAKLINFK